VGLVRAIFECACKCRLDRSEDHKGQYVLVLKEKRAFVSCVRGRGQREEREVKRGLALGKPEGRENGQQGLGVSVAVIVLTFECS